MPKFYTVDVETIEEVLTNGTDLTDKIVYVKHKTSNFHNLGTGVRDIFTITVNTGDYIVKDHEDRTMVETSGTEIIIRQVSTNPYEKDFLQSFPIQEIDKKQEVLQAIKLLAFKGVSFGGEQPYIDLLEEVYIGFPEGYVAPAPEPAPAP